jgi:hypothetical protein
MLDLIAVALPEISILSDCSINHPPAPSNRKMYMYMYYMTVYKIGILGNLPIAHDSVWVLEVMFIEKKFEFEEVLHCTCLKFDLGPKSKPFKIFRVNMYRNKFTQIQ